MTVPTNSDQSTATPSAVPDPLNTTNDWASKKSAPPGFERRLHGPPYYTICLKPGCGPPHSSRGPGRVHAPWWRPVLDRPFRSAPAASLSWNRNHPQEAVIPPRPRCGRGPTALRVGHHSLQHCFERPLRHRGRESTPVPVPAVWVVRASNSDTLPDSASPVPKFFTTKCRWRPWRVRETREAKVRLQKPHSNERNLQSPANQAAGPSRSRRERTYCPAQETTTQWQPAQPPVCRPTRRSLEAT